MRLESEEWSTYSRLKSEKLALHYTRHFRDTICSFFSINRVDLRPASSVLSPVPDPLPFPMLSESFIASTLSSAKTPTATLRDVGICLQEFQPSPQLRSTFKKSSTSTNCLAVTPSHIFSAQADKAVVHVYSREKGNQEALVPFPERIRSIAVADAKYGDVLILGTEGGRLILWEV